VFPFPKVSRLPPIDKKASYREVDTFESLRKENEFFPFQNRGDMRLASWIEKVGSSVQETKELLDILREEFRLKPGFNSKDALNKLWDRIPSLVFSRNPPTFSHFSNLN